MECVGVSNSRRRRGVINTVEGIKERADDVDKRSLFGASAMGFPDKISTVRGGMATKHATQRVVLTDPEFPMVYTGAENPYGEKSSWNIKANGDYQLMKIFRKFTNVPCSPIAYIFKNLDTGKYLCKVIKPVEHLVEKYGFRMNSNMGKYVEGDIIPSESVIAQSVSYINDNYCAGRNVRIANAVLPELTEDALVISDYVSEALRYDMVDVVKVDINRHAFLLNNYGDSTLYKPFPDIGEEVRDNIICSIRENSYLSTITEASIPHIKDRNIFTNGTLVDIDIHTNVEVENEQFNYYLSQIRDWYSDIYSYISTIIVDKYQDDTSLLDIYHQAEKYLNSSSWVTKEYVLDTLIKFTVLQPKRIQIGQKMVGRYGNKTTVAKIIPRDLMPKTDDGRPIDILSNALAVPNRIIAFSLYENTMTFQMDRMHQHILKMKESGSTPDEIVNLVIEFVGIYNQVHAEDIARLYHAYPDETYKDIITNGIFLQVEPLNDTCIRDAILEAYEKFPDILKEYKLYTKLRHRWIENEETFAIGYQYMWVLKQEPSKSMSAVSTGRTTLYDLPVKTRQYNKNLRHYSDNPIKFGEYDTYNFLAGVGIKSFAKISSYFRGSQYEENSVLMSHLNNMKIDTSKYNKFPQLDNLKNVLKLMGIRMAPDVFGYNTIGNVDDEMDLLFNNVTVKISIPDLRYVLIMYSYYMQYESYKNGTVDMIDFFNNITKTNLFDGVTDQVYINTVFERFVNLLPTLQQLKQYQ